MSDNMRKGLGEQTKEKATPDSQKSTLDQTKESVTGMGDRAAGAVQPEGDKSATQKLGDSTRGGGDQSKGVLEQAQESISNAAGSVQEAVAGNNQKK